MSTDRQTFYRQVDRQLAQDVQKGLSTFPKSLPSKYFYNAEGSRIFQQIMELEEYYPTNCEFEILTTQKALILDSLPSAFDLVELGAGDGLKTKILLKHFLNKQIDFKYLPIDISVDILHVLKYSLEDEMPELRVQTLHDDYFGALQKISSLTHRPKVVLFLGGNIGNFSLVEAQAFLTKLRASLNKGDFLLMGIDLIKNPETILHAYSDSEGVTAAFNYNLLQRINDELDANFDISQFMHFANYEPQTGETKSYLISKINQKVWIKGLQMDIHFDAWESIHTELSQKFSVPQIVDMAFNTGFKVKNHFFDTAQYFTDTLWEAV